METVFWCSAFGVVYAYFGYALILAILNRVLGRPVRVVSKLAKLPPLTVIISARNESSVIRSKLANTLEMNYAGQSLRNNPLAEVIVTSDCSDDGTDEIVGEFSDQGVKLVRLETRGGKERAQIEAVALAKGEVIVFTDAKIMLGVDAIERFAAYFEDPMVGAVSSVDKVISSSGQGSGEGMYVRYEMWLRALESRFLSLVGVSGSCFAVRREICADLRSDIPSDFALLLASRRRGLIGVNAPDVVATYESVADEKAEFGRKVRTVLRGLTTLFACYEVLNPAKYGVFSFQVASHKLARWLVPIWIIAGTLAAFALAKYSHFYSLVAFLMLAFYFGAVVGYLDLRLREKPWCKVPLFFLVVNGAIAVAWMKFLRGERTVAWTPSAKGAAK